MLYLGLVSSFCIEYFTSFDNSIETAAAVFLCLRTKKASNSSKRERNFYVVTLGTSAKYE